MAKPGLTHMMVEPSTLDELDALLGKSARLKFTSLSVSRKFLALGTNTGGVYIFSRDTLKYLQVVFGDTEACPVVRVSLSPSDQHVALALSTGNVWIIELNIDRRSKPEKLRHSHEHVGQQVTALTWDTTCSKMFIGDDAGKVSIIFVPSSKSKMLFAVPTEVIAYLECSVYQMEWWRDKLLVSTIKHSHLFDTIKHNYSTIGTKTREGEFGSCFFMEPRSQVPVIYCARPGSRMWEVDFEGKVLNTHQFKQLLAVPSVPVVRLMAERLDEVRDGPYAAQSANFFKMLRIGQFILTWSTKGLYVFDPVNVKVIARIDSITGIRDAHVYNNDVYIFLDNSCIQRMTLLPIYQLFTVLSTRKLWTLMSSLILAADQLGIRPAIVRRVKQDLLQNLLQGLRENDMEEEVERVRAAMEDLSEGSIDSLASEDLMDVSQVMGHTYLSSGMVVVSEGVQVKAGVDRRDQMIGTSARMEEGKEKEGEIVNVEYEKERVGENIVIAEDSKETVGMNSSLYDRESPVNEKGDISDLQMQVSHDDLNNGPKHKTAADGHNLPVQGSDGLSVNADDVVVSNICVDPGAPAAPAKMDANSNVNSVSDDCEKSEGMINHVQTDNAAENGGSQILDEKLEKEKNGEIFHSDENVRKSSPDHLSTETGVESIAGVADVTDAAEEGSGCDVSKIQFQDVESLIDYSNSLEDNNSSDVGTSHSSRNMQNSPADIGNSNVGLSNVDEDVCSTARDTTANSSVSETTQGKVSQASDQSSSEQKDNGVNSEKMGKVAEDANFKLCDQSELSNNDSSRENGKGPDGSDVSTMAQVASIHQDQAQSKVSEPQDDTASSTTPASTTMSAATSAPLPQSSQVSVSSSTEKNIQKAAEQAPFTSTNGGHIVEKSSPFLPDGKANTSSHEKPQARDFASIDVTKVKDSSIAKPHKPSKKKKKKKDSLVRSVSLGNPRPVLPSPEELDDIFYEKPDIEMDTLSIGTIDSIEEEKETKHAEQISHHSHSPVTVPSPTVSGRSTPQASVELSASPPVTSRRVMSRKSSVPASYEEIHTEVIPPLIDRLVAARGSGSSDDFLVGMTGGSQSQASLTGSGEHLHTGGHSRVSLSSLKDELSLKLKTQTKSLLKSFKEKNLRMTRSSSTSNLATLSNQQLDDSSEKRDQHEMQLDRAEEGKEKSTQVIDSMSLYVTAQEIKQRLLTTSAFLHPDLLRHILTEWAVELIKVMCEYHKRLAQQNRVAQGVENGGELDRQSREDNKGSQSIRQDVLQSQSELVQFGRDETSAEDDGSTTNCQQNISEGKNGDQEQASDLPNGHASHEHFLPSCDYWVKVMHAQDPFQLPNHHKDLFTELTTLCFVCGVIGDILTILQVPAKLLCDNSDGAATHSLCKGFCHNLLRPSSHVEERTFSQKQPGNEASLSGQKQIVKPDLTMQGTSADRTTGELNGGGQNVRHKEENTFHDLTFEKDLSLSLFTRLFFFLLDYEQVKRWLDSRGCSMFHTWSAMTVCSREKGDGDIVSSILAEGQLKSAIDYLRSGILPHPSAMLGHLYRLFEQAPSRASEFCGEIQKSVSASDIIQMSALCGKSPSVYLLRYVRQVMVDLATGLRPAAFQALCQHREVRYYMLEALLPTLVTQSADDGNKSLASQMTSVLSFDWLQVVCSKIDSQQERMDIIQLSLKLGHWRLCLQLLMESNQWQSMLQLIVDLNDISLFTENFLPKSVEQWGHLLQCFHVKITTLQQKHSECAQNMQLNQPNGWHTGQRSDMHVDLSETESRSEMMTENIKGNFKNGQGNSRENKGGHLEHQVPNRKDQYSLRVTVSELPELRSGSKITWEGLAYLMLPQLGGVGTLRLLSEHLEDEQVSSLCLNPDFLHACYKDFVVESQKCTLAHDILEKLSIYMWAKKPDYVPPSVHQALMIEKKDTRGREVVTNEALVSQLKITDTNELMSEYLASPWGQEVNISSPCPSCQLTLKSVVSLSAPGVTVFPCGHAYHKCCVLGPTCPALHI